MTVYAGRRTRRQLIDQALTVVGNTKIVTQARVELARILEDLYVQHEWPWLYTETTLTLVAETSLPTDFLKVESEDTGLRGTAVDGETDDWPIYVIGPTEWRRQAIPRDQTSDRPQIAMIDYAQSILKPWPVPESSVTALLVYKALPADVDPADTATYDADVPMFPYARYLEAALEAWGFGYEKDMRSKALKDAENAKMLSELLALAIPRDANQAASLELDPVTYLRPPRWNEST